jgi:sterol desaturase/sphingolipid hydroxylase (fatty acid hydroxylase superfamily)
MKRYKTKGGRKPFMYHLAIGIILLIAFSQIAVVIYASTSIVADVEQHDGSILKSAGAVYKEFKEASKVDAPKPTGE